jgi:hypothetical protein
MNIYLIIFLFLLALFFIYWLYKKYNNCKDQKKVNYLKEMIKNNITITMYNMNKFLNITSQMKKEILPIAMKYKHGDIINLLTKN